MDVAASRRPDDDQRGEEVIAAGAPAARLRWARARVERVGETDSTNRVVADAARAGAGEGYVVVADSQTAGRGRLDRRWTARPGSSLLCSLLFIPRLPDGLLHLPGMLVSLAARDACAGAAAAELSLKWPNDLVVAGPGGGWRKVGGVLAEVVAAPERAVVVGIGINVNWSEVDIAALGVPASALNLLAGGGGAIDRGLLLDALLEGVGGRRHLLDTPAGRRSLLEEYRRACSTLGRRVRVELARESFEGTAVGIDGSGRLLVETALSPGSADEGALHEDPHGSSTARPGSLRAVAVGDVVHLR